MKKLFKKQTIKIAEPLLEKKLYLSDFEQDYKCHFARIR